MDIFGFKKMRELEKFLDKSKRRVINALDDVILYDASYDDLIKFRERYVESNDFEGILKIDKLIFRNPLKKKQKKIILSGI